MRSGDISWGDQKPAPRIRDPELLRLLHASRDKECVFTGAVERLELHHILPRSQRGDDVRANLVWLAAEHHRRITANDPDARRRLGEYLQRERPDFFVYLVNKFNSPTRAREWIERRLLVDW